MASSVENFHHQCVQETSSIIRNLRDNEVTCDALENAKTRLCALLRNCRRVSSEFEPCAVLCETLEAVLTDIQEQKQRIRPLLALQPRREQGTGRPRYIIARAQLEFFSERGFSCRDMAKLLHVSQSSVKRRLRSYGINLRSRYSQITDAELDEKVRAIVGSNASLGQRIVQGSLTASGIVVQRRRVADSLIRIDEAAVALRWANTIRRRQYSVSGPNALWHIDGNHKLIRWNFVIHGGIDGFSRLCTFLRVADNNRADTMDRTFLEGVSEYGLPSRVRCDHGLENTGVASFMLAVRGTGRGSIITGRSVHNVRIERLWRDMFTSCTSVFHHMFSDLESSGQLRLDSDQDMWCLHFVFLGKVQTALDTFRKAWNNHRLSTEAGKTPEQLYVQGTLRLAGQGHRGIDDLLQPIGEEVPDDLAEYGVDDEDTHLHRPDEQGDAREDLVLFPCPVSAEQLEELKERLRGIGEDRLGYERYMCVKKSKGLNHAGDTTYKTQSYPNSIMTKGQIM